MNAALPAAVAAPATNLRRVILLAICILLPVLRGLS
jgi:hypothetical protein